MNDLKIYITIGNNQALGMNQGSELVLFETKQHVITNYVSLGKFTKRKKDILKESLEALALHIDKED